MVQHGADGLIVLGGADGNPDVLTARFAGLPTVFVEFDTLGSRTAHVSIDNETAFWRSSSISRRPDTPASRRSRARSTCASRPSA